MSKNNTKVTLKKPSKKQIESVLKGGIEAQGKLEEISHIIKADLCHVDEENKTQLTRAFDKILDDKNKDEEMKQNIKMFIGKQFQTLIKEKPTQLAILEDNMEDMTVTVKKVNKAMVENNDGKYVDSFNESELGSYRVVRIHKTNEDLSLAQELAKWMRSQKSKGCFKGDKSTAKDVGMYDLNLIRMTLDNLEKGVEEL